jgi:hypothetical protein
MSLRSKKVIGAVVLILGVMLVILGSVLLDFATGITESYNAYFIRGLGIVLTFLGVVLYIFFSVKQAVAEKRFSAVLHTYFGKSMIGFTIARITASVLLIWGLGEHPYDYYTLLRFVVCSTTAYGTFLAVRFKQITWAWIFGIVAVLFNPIFPIHLEKSTWGIIDVVVALLLIVSIFLFRVTKADKQGSK